ncbi:MAG TPA: aldo/keto reductase [Terriglobales bacterium]|nr:aldo/keto reductase [Terriglobales bacterium]
MAEDEAMIERIPFGRTGHRSSRVLFGAAGLATMRQDSADRVLEQLLAYGINHLDTAASYGDAELRIGPWMREHRRDFFLATKTGERDYQRARDSIHRSLERLRVDQLDLIQLHNLVPERDWATALGPGGALEALIEAREQGLVRFLGVTGHGLDVARMHRRSLERFPFDAVLLPYNFTMMSQPHYAAHFEALANLCAARCVAMQTIKSLARRRWAEVPARRFSWYEPVRDPDAIRRAVHFVLARPTLFLNSASDLSLLPAIFAAASEPIEPPSEHDLEADTARLGIEPLFIAGGPQGTL